MRQVLYQSICANVKLVDKISIQTIRIKSAIQDAKLRLDNFLSVFSMNKLQNKESFI